jgi:hypothetical protein
MPIQFACTHCNRSYRVSDANAAKRFACKQCGQPVEVPAMDAGNAVRLEFPPGPEPQVEVPQEQLEFAPEPQYVAQQPQQPYVPHGQYVPHTPVMPRPRHGPGSTDHLPRRPTTRVNIPAHPGPDHGAYLPPHGEYPQQYAGPQPTSMMALIGLILAFVFWPAGLVLSFIGLKETSPRGGKSGRGLAIAGVTLNILSLVLTVILMLVVVIAFKASEGAFTQESQQAMQADFDVIKKRLQQYYLANKNSLAAGGPAQARSVAGQSVLVLSPSALADPGELRYPRQVGNPTDEVYRIEVTGPNSARVSCWYGVQLAYMDISDVAGAISTVEWQPGRRK